MLSGNRQSILLFEPYQRPVGCPAFAVLKLISKPYWSLSGGAFLSWCHALPRKVGRRFFQSARPACAVPLRALLP